MARFSERYGYVEVSDVIIREGMPEEIQNAICNAFLKLNQSLYYPAGSYGDNNEKYTQIEKYLWLYFFNKKEADFGKRPSPFLMGNIEDKAIAWYLKIDLLETVIQYISHHYLAVAEDFIEYLNSEFERHNYAYRIIDNKVVEITSKEEIQSIETAINNDDNSVKHHLQKALELYAKKPEGDYQNSIKESITAVEAFTRNITGEKTLNLTKLEDKGIVLPSTLKNAFQNLYGYTNDASTGIRHALMDDVNKPNSEEALFMLVSCSAFINYLTKKGERSDDDK